MIKVLLYHILFFFENELDLKQNLNKIFKSISPVRKKQNKPLLRTIYGFKNMKKKAVIIPSTQRAQKEKDLDLIVEANLLINQPNCKVKSTLSKSIIDRAEENLGINIENLRKTQLAFSILQQENREDSKSFKKYFGLPDTIIKNKPSLNHRFISTRLLKNKNKDISRYNIEKSLVEECSNIKLSSTQDNNYRTSNMRILNSRVSEDHNRNLSVNIERPKTSRVVWKSSIKEIIYPHKIKTLNEERPKTKKFISPLRSYIDKNIEIKKMIFENSLLKLLSIDCGKES